MCGPRLLALCVSSFTDMSYIDTFHPAVENNNWLNSFDDQVFARINQLSIDDVGQFDD